MRILTLLLLLTACTQVHSNNAVQLFEVSIVLNESCQIKANSSSKAVVHDFTFEPGGECRIVTHANTSIPITYFINGSYILFVEKNHPKGDSCYSEHTAIAIDKNQQLLTTPIIKKSGSCFQSKELSAFEYFSQNLKYTQE
jgi:hypothetical protein